MIMWKGRGRPRFDAEFSRRVDAMLEWEAEHGPVMHVSANNWSRVERPFSEAISGMGKQLPAHLTMVEDAVTTGSRRPFALEGWSWRMESPCRCCLFGYVNAEGSRMYSFGTGGFDDPCEVGAKGWQGLLREPAETPGFPDPEEFARAVASISPLPPERPDRVPPRRPWLLSLQFPQCAQRAVAGEDLSWLQEFEVATAWTWGLHLLGNEETP